MLKQADERFYETVLKPGQGAYGPGAWLGIMQEQIIKEADELIDGTNVVNAPHVAALPPQEHDS